MCELVSKTFRPAHRDVEITYRDSFGVEKKLYVGLPDDVKARIQKHFAEEDAICEAVRKAAEA